MTKKEAKQYVNDFYYLSNPTDQQEHDFVEALEYLISRGPKDREYDRYNLELGSYYYGKKLYDLARKYYSVAAEYGNKNAMLGLGYIYYYGRCGQVDYEKAFYYYSQVSDTFEEAAYKVADMYKNGYYVEKDMAKYEEIVTSLYTKLQGQDYVNCYSYASVLTRMGGIAKAHDNPVEALQYYLKARHYLAEEITYNHFFGNFTVMGYLIEDIYEIIDVDEDYLDLFDLYEILKRPATVQFEYNDTTYTIKAVEEDNHIIINFMDKWYRTINDFMMKATIDDVYLTALYQDLFAFEVIKDDNN